MSFLSSRGWKIYLALVGLGTVIAVFITVLVLLPGYLQHKRTAASLPSGYQGMKESDRLAGYKIPEEYSKLLSEQWKQYYALKGTWGKEDISKYWVDPEKMALQFLQGENSTIIEKLLDTYD